MRRHRANVYAASLWPLLLVAMQLQPAATAAQLPGLTPLAQRCIAGGEPQTCQAALKLSHGLKQRAEQQNKLSCYTQLLALESHLIIQSLDGSDGPAAAMALEEATRSCGW